MTTLGKYEAYFLDMCNEKIKNEYVPDFINAIREQCSWLIGTLSSGLSRKEDNKREPKNVMISGNPRSFSLSNAQESKQKFSNTGKQTKSTRRKYVPLTPVERILPPNISDVQEFPPIGSDASVCHSSKYTLLQKRFSSKINNNLPLNHINYSSENNKTNRFMDRMTKNDSRNIFVNNKNLTNQLSNAFKNSDKNIKSSNCESKQNDICDSEVILPSLKLVTNKESIDYLVNAYCRYIDINSMPNLNVELYFLFQLFTAKTAVMNCNVNSPLNTIHNCVYFSISVMNKQRDLLSSLDRTTLRLMCEIPHLSEFSKDLHKYLSELYIERSSDQNHRMSSIQGVSFQADTDNRSNFSSDLSFNTFKKQRDAFYELFREWKEQHFSPDWIKKSNFVSRVKYIINLSSAAINIGHFARLIQSQLTAVCDNEGCIENNENEEEIANLKRSFPDKFEKLQQRFKTPLRVSGPNPLPSFHGSQEFFRDFLDAACSVSLNQHLIDNFVAKIIELDKLELTVDTKIGIDESLKEKYFYNLCLLRTLAKFLGFLVFLPYQNFDFVPADVITSQCSLRNACCPPLDILTLLLDAKRNNRLILTVPWVVEYISMMDPIAPYLDYYQNIFKILFQIYKSSNNIICNKNRNLIKFVLGWLFETPNFPTSSFFLYIDKKFNIENVSVTAEGLDMLEVVDQQVIYSCCPYLGELRILLEEYLIGIKRKGQEIRKINPLAADNMPSLCVAAEKLEYKLEDNFFHLQSPSVRKTVEFVAERISSKAIHQIRNEIIPLTKLDSVQKLKHLNERTEVNSFTEISISGLTDISEKLYNEIQIKSIEFANLYCKHKIENVMPLLLQDEIDQDIIKTCNSISCRMAVNKVVQWIKTYITYKYVLNDMKMEVEKLSKQKNSNSFKNSNLKTTTLISDLIINLRKTIKEMQENKSCCSEKISEHLLHIKIIINNETSQSAIKLIGSMTVEFLIFLLIFEPNLLEKFLYDFNYLWCNTFSDNSDVTNLLCPKNLNFLILSQNLECTWTKFTILYQNLLHSKRITLKDLQRNCKLIFKQEWPKYIFNKLLLFVKDCISDLKLLSSNNNNNNNHSKTNICLEFYGDEHNEIVKWASEYQETEN